MKHWQAPFSLVGRVTFFVTRQRRHSRLGAWLFTVERVQVATPAATSLRDGAVVWSAKESAPDGAADLVASFDSLAPARYEGANRRRVQNEGDPPHRLV